MKQLKNATLIKAWADGAEIEKQSNTGEWFIDYKPDWHDDGHYRIFQEIKPDIVDLVRVHRHRVHKQNTPYLLAPTTIAPANLKLTFDSETGALKAAEVIE